MAITAEETTSIVQLVVGMAGVAPRPEDLADLVAEFEAGSSLVQIAQNIVDHPAYSGDTGLFPSYLPNSIWATQYLTMLIGDEVSADDLAAAIATTTADLNAGSTRAEVSVAAIDALAAETPAVGFEDAAAALANKTTVAEYYAVNSVAVDANIAAMTAAIADVDNSAASVTAGTGAIDVIIAAAQPAGTLIENLDAANTAKAAFLTAEATTEGAIGTAVATAVTAIQTAGVAGYDGATANVQAALLADQQTTNGGLLTAAQGALTTALGATGTGGVVGLDTAIANFDNAADALTAADLNAALAVNDQASAVANYDTLNASGIAVAGNGTVAGVIKITGTTLSFDTAVTEATDPGVTVLLAAIVANLAAIATAAAADTAVEDALDNVENLDYVGSAGAATLGLVGAAMLINPPAVAAGPTLAEIASETAAQAAGLAQLKADIEAVSYAVDDTSITTALTAVLDAAITAKVIDEATNGDKTAILAALVDPDVADGDTTDDFATPATLTAALGVVSAAATANSNDAVLAVLVGNNLGTGNGAQTIAAATAPKAADAATKAGAVTSAALVITTLASKVSDKADAEANVVSLAALNSDVADAIAAFADADLTVPVTLNSAVKAATAGDDVFLVDGIDSQIISFGLTGDDTLYIGTDLTLNDDATAGDEGDNDVLEVWITASGSDTVITIEETVFGSEAASPETYEITLTGVASTDVSLGADGFVTIV